MNTITHLSSILLTIVVFCLGHALAGEVTIPHNFVADTPAVAAEMNANFNAVAAEVNDNSARIDDNNAGMAAKQNRVAGQCPQGRSIRVVNEDGTVVCEDDNDSGGDITAVTPGLFMSGGGHTGQVTLGVSAMPGVAWAETGTNRWMSTADAVIMSKQINAPSDGYVFVIFTGTAGFSHTFNTWQSLDCWLNTDGGSTPYGQSRHGFFVDGQLPTTAYYYNVASTCIIPVGAGVTTVYAVGHSSEPAGNDNTRFFRCSLNLLFFPARY